MKLTDLTANFADFLRPNLYLVYIFPKTKFADFKNLGFICHEATFPFHTFNTTDVFYNNTNHSFVNKIDYDPASFSFYADKFNELFKFFDAWRKQIVNDDFQLGFYDNYVAQIDIQIIDRVGDTAAIASLIDAYPINIDNIALSYATNDEIMNVQTSFKFNRIEYTYKDRPQQHKDINAKTTSWKDLFTLNNLRRGVNLISKIKNYQYLLKNGNAYDIVSQAGNIFATVKGSTGALPIESASKAFKQVRSAQSIFNSAEKASKLF